MKNAFVLKAESSSLSLHGSHIARIGDFSFEFWKKKSPILTTSENQALPRRRSYVPYYGEGDDAEFIFFQVGSISRIDPSSL